MKFYLSYTLLSILVFSTQLKAQPSFHYLENLTIEGGLSSNAVTDVVQDGDDYLWIATSNGLNRYDGAEVIKFFKHDEHSLPDNKIYDLEKLDSFHFAIATHYGLSIFNTRTKTFRNIFIKSEKSFAPYDNHIKFMARDKQGNLWAASLTSIYRFDSSSHLQKTFRFLSDSSVLTQRRIDYIGKMIPLESGDLLIWTDNGTKLWNHKKDQIEDLDLSSSSKWHFLKYVPFTQCFKVYGHYLIIIHNNRLLLYDELTGRTASATFPFSLLKSEEWAQIFSTLQNGWVAFSLGNEGVVYIRIKDSKDSLSIFCNNKIFFKNHIFRKWIMDSEGNWWITTYKDGLIKISPSKQLFKEKKIVNPSTGSLSNFGITDFYAARGKFFMSTYGGGIYKFDTSSGKQFKYTVNLNKEYQNIIWNIHAYKKDTLWVGTSGGLFSYNLKNNQFSLLKIPHPTVLDSFPITTDFTDSKGLVWMGIGHGHGVCTYNPGLGKFTLYPNRNSAYPFRYPLSIAEDSASNLWFQSDNTHDLVKWNRHSKKFSVMPVLLKNGERNLPTGHIYLDKNGIIWFGVETFGLIGYNIQTGKTKTYGMDKGLSTDMIYYITEDKSNRLWLGTDQGVSTFDPAIKQFVNYGLTDGLPSGPYSSRFYFDSLSQRMHVATPEKLISFSPKDFTKKAIPTKVAITRLTVNAEPKLVPESRKIKLSFKENDITIYFTGINLTNGTENKYAYKLGGKESKWINIGSQRQIRFASLKPGTYDFYVRAARKNGTWSPRTDHLSFIITPPFTSTAWFYLIILAIVSGSIYAWYRYRLQTVRKLEKIRTGISHNLHDEIGSRLTNISMMSLVAKQQEDENSATAEWLERIIEESQAVSQSMREIVWNINPDNDSLEEAFPRILQYTTGMLEAKGIEVNASVANLQGIKMDMEKRRDFFLIFKEAIQNILKHSEARNIHIQADLKDGCLFLNIKDDGKGFDMKNLPFLNGLNYMKQRAQRHHWNCEINSIEGSGAETRLRIKIK